MTDSEEDVYGDYGGYAGYHIADFSLLDMIVIPNPAFDPNAIHEYRNQVIRQSYDKKSRPPLVSNGTKND